MYRLADGLASLDVPRVARRGDDVVKDDVFGEQVEEVIAVGEAVEALLDDAEERLQRLEVFEVVDRAHDALLLRPGLCGPSGERGETDRRPSGDVLNIVVGPGAMARGDRFGQHAEHLAVRGRHAGRDGAVDPCTA